MITSHSCNVLKRLLLGSLLALCLPLSAHLQTLKVPLEKAQSFQFYIPQSWAKKDQKEVQAPYLIRLEAPSYAHIAPNLTLAQHPLTPLTPEFFQDLKQQLESTGLYQWQQMGSVDTPLGKAPLVYIKGETEASKVSILQLYISHHQHLYLLTATATEEEFPKHFKNFLTCMTSFRLLTKKNG